MTKFEKFLKENDAKRVRANAKAVTERKIRDQKEVEIGQLSRHLVVEQGKALQIARLIKNHQEYEGYLQSIVDVLPPDYLDVHEPQINDIIMRYKTLIETNQDLCKEAERNHEWIEKAQGTLQGLVKDKNDLLLVTNSNLGSKQKTLDKIKEENLSREGEVEQKNNLGKERVRNATDSDADIIGGQACH